MNTTLDLQQILFRSLRYVKVSKHENQLRVSSSLSSFFWPQMALAYRLDAIAFTGPKKLEISRAHPLPLAFVKDAARFKSITHGAV
jgi:hypothetical protein